MLPLEALSITPRSCILFYLFIEPNAHGADLVRCYKSRIFNGRWP